MATVLICPNPGCQSEVTGRFCSRCGADVAMIACSTCGQRHPPERLEADAPACEACGAPLSRQLLIVVPPGHDPGASRGDLLADGRYRVIGPVAAGQYLGLATQPNAKRLVVPPATGAAAVYLQLARHRGIPTLLDFHATEDGSQILVLSPPASSEGELHATLANCWPGASRRRRVSWLLAWLDLLVTTTEAGYAQSALELDNLLVAPDDSLGVRVLLRGTDDGHIPVQLGEVWQRLLGTAENGAGGDSGGLAVDLARRAASGQVSLRELRDEVAAWRHRPPVAVSHAGGTDPGLRRANNEDTFLAWHGDISRQGPDGFDALSRGIFVVCDGMGGHARGEVASRIAVDTLQVAVRALLDERDPAEGDFAARLAAIVRQDVNSAIHDLNASEPESTLKRMGTTLVSLVQVDDRAWRVHVGDSRLYAISGRGIEQLTDDHNIGTRDVKRGVATLLEAFRSPVGKHLTQALGPKGSEYVQPDVGELPLEEPCAFVLCSDGLSDMVPEPDIERIVRAHWDDPARAVAELIREANAGGGLDNISAIVVRFEPSAALF